MTKVLLVGDSIRLSYMPRVRELLEGKAVVWGPEDNCRFAKYTLWYIEEWMGHFGRPDIIHWNNGIWDAYAQNPQMGVFTPLEQYMEDMARIYAQMKLSGARILFATTTPVADSFARVSNDEINRYNAEMLRFCRMHGIPVNDLHGLIDRDKTALIAEDLLHLSPEGIRLAGNQTAGFIESFLNCEALDNKQPI